MNLDDRIKIQFPVLIVTLLSVLIGLDFADLVGTMRARMTLWPLDIETLRTWGQVFTMASFCVSTWITYAHLGISRLRIPAFADSMVVFLIPLMVLFGNSLVGQREIWPWFCFASAYLVVAVGAWQWQVRIVLADNELASFARLASPFGPLLTFVYPGIVFYAVAGWADSHGLFSPVAEALACMVGIPTASLTAWLFVREWRTAVAQAQVSEPQAATVAAG